MFCKVTIDDSTHFLAFFEGNMRYLEIKEIMNEDIDIRDVCVVPVRERNDIKKTFKKRSCNVMFLYLSGKREYFPDGEKPFFLTPGNIMYVPEGASYRFHILEGDPLDYAIAVDFSMRDKNGESVCIGKSPTVIAKDGAKHYENLFSRALLAASGTRARTMILKSVVYQLFYEIFTEKIYKDYKKLPWRDILPAIDKIESFPSQDTPIPELSKLCGVCETKFRKLFLQYTGGLSPVEYRNKLRIEQVEQSLKTEEMTVEQAAREAGFRDMSHFYRLYKRHKSKGVE